MRYLIWLMIIGPLVVITTYEPPAWLSALSWLFLSWGIAAIAKKLWPMRVS